MDCPFTQVSAILTTKGKARLQLTSAIGGDDEMLDVNELKLRKVVKVR